MYECIQLSEYKEGVLLAHPLAIIENNKTYVII